MVDKQEAWHFHIHPDDTGSSAVWAAQRIPADHVSVVANMFVIREVPSFLFQCSSFHASVFAPSCPFCYLLHNRVFPGLHSSFCSLEMILSGFCSRATCAAWRGDLGSGTPTRMECSTFSVPTRCHLVLRHHTPRGECGGSSAPWPPPFACPETRISMEMTILFLSKRKSRWTHDPTPRPLIRHPI